jgi:two-component system, OmpR family, copper resistance phosphate regulon response regulator CusR
MRILIIEDEEKLAKSLKKILEAETYCVDIVNTYNQGYEKSFDDVYDIILLDLGLPDGDGIQLAEQLRDEKLSTPILILTARDAVKNKILGLNAGADDYLVKPFDFDELIARIRALTRKYSAAKSILYKISDLELNEQTKKVTRSGIDISLSAKEFSVLHYLLQHQGEIVTKQQLIDHCWDSDLDPFSNTVDVYIGYIRKKIDRNFPQKSSLLKTFKGFGYKIG